MKIAFIRPTAFLPGFCGSTNPERGIGGEKVDQQTALSSAAIVDSAKAIIGQSVVLRPQHNGGKISNASFRGRNASLMATYKMLDGSLSLIDTLAVSEHQ